MRQELRQRILAIALALLIIMVFTYWFEDSSITRVSGVTTIGVGVYSGVNCAQPVTSINWGTLSAGSTKNTIVYVRNEAQQLISLTMSTQSWSPSNASSYIRITWDYSGQVMNPNSVLKVTLMLSVSSSLPKISGVSFNLVIAGVGVSSNVIFSDGFESGNFKAWNGTYITTGETATVVSTLHESGSYSAMFTSHGGSAVARAYCYENLPNQSQLYTLAYVYFNSSVSLPNGDNLWLIQFRDSGGNAIASFGASRDSTSVKWATQYGTSTKSYATSGPTAHVWYAVEAYFNKTSSGKALVIYVNGTQVAALSVSTSGVNSVAQVRVGIAYNAVGYKNYVYVDTVTIDNKYITPPS